MLISMSLVDFIWILIKPDKKYHLILVDDNGSIWGIGSDVSCRIMLDTRC